MTSIFSRKGEDNEEEILNREVELASGSREGASSCGYREVSLEIESRDALCNSFCFLTEAWSRDVNREMLYVNIRSGEGNWKIGEKVWNEMTKD